MTSTELMSQEILRLSRATRHSAFINTRRLSDFYHVPEKSVRREMAKLADEKRSRLKGELTGDAFVDKAPEGMSVRVDLIE